jgi:hypothetical protein
MTKSKSPKTHMNMITIKNLKREKMTRNLRKTKSAKSRMTKNLNNQMNPTTKNLIN